MLICTILFMPVEIIFYTSLIILNSLPIGTAPSLLVSDSFGLRGGNSSLLVDLNKSLSFLLSILLAELHLAAIKLDSHSSLELVVDLAEFGLAIINY